MVAHAGGFGAHVALCEQELGFHQLYPALGAPWAGLVLRNHELFLFWPARAPHAGVFHQHIGAANLALGPDFGLLLRLL